MSESNRESESGPWQLDATALRALLGALDADPGHAAREYERLRRRLVRYFGLHGLPHPFDAVDEAFNRLAKRLGEGEPVRNVEAYLAGIARLVMLEQRQKLARERQMLLRLVDSPPPNEEDDRMLRALEGCLGELSEESRALLTRYYVARGMERIRARERIARELGVSANSLRNRMLRLRQRLERAVRARLGESERDGLPADDTLNEEND